MRFRRILFLAALLLLVIADLRRPPSEQLAARAALGGIHLYQATLSRWYAAAGVRCRFTPTCSRYGETCIREFGAARGGWLALRRVLRCGPWTPAGTVDEPPRADGKRVNPLALNVVAPARTTGVPLR